ncbi:MAG: YceI family protein [Candidatus Omnitrophica bacterium]|nr:YceI family protein [Candidatus Omnitrophota bacterium]
MSRYTGRLAAVAMMVALWNPAALAGTYTFDRERTTITYTVHTLFSRIHGRFRDFEGTFTYQPEAMSASSVRLMIDAGSADRKLPRRVFDTVRYPVIRFESTGGVDDIAGAQATLPGRLAMHGFEHPVVMALTIQPPWQDAQGRWHPRFSGTASVDRRAYHLIWRRTFSFLELFLTDQIDITFDVEGNPA